MTRSAAAWRPGNLRAPTQLSGCVLWLDASQLTVVPDGTTVATLTDLSGGALGSPTQATDAKRGKYYASQVNGHPVVRFDGATSWYATPSGGSAVGLTGDAPFTVIAVPKFAAFTSNPVLLSIGSLIAANQAYCPGGDATNGVLAILAGNTIRFSPNVAVTAFHVVSHVHKAGHVTVNTAAFFNGARFAPPATPVGFASNLRNAVLYVGGAYGGAAVADGSNPTNYLNGDLPELAVFNRALGDGERAAFETCLANKYGLALTGAISRSAAPTRSAAPARAAA